LQHDDLYRMLYDLAISSGVIVTFNSVVTAVSIDEFTNTPYVYLASGEILNADVVIGADGYRSIARMAMLQRDEDGVDSGMSGLT
jgi:salicylate hydroxylase